MREKVLLYTDEYIIRLTALQVFVLTLGVITFKSILLISLLIVDFGLRSFTKLPAPLVLNSKIILRYFPRTSRPVFNPPKRFAALIGFVMAVAISILLVLDYEKVFYLVVAILSFCAFLESFFKICVGCYMYSLGSILFAGLIRK